MGMIPLFCQAIFLHATKGIQERCPNPWNFNLHLGLTERTTKIANKTDYWVHTHFPEYTEKGVSHKLVSRLCVHIGCCTPGNELRLGDNAMAMSMKKRTVTV